VEDCGYDHRLYQTKEYKIGTSFFSAKYTASRSKNKAYLTLNLESVILEALEGSFLTRNLEDFEG
jgi:hypothetical protein